MSDRVVHLRFEYRLSQNDATRAQLDVWEERQASSQPNRQQPSIPPTRTLVDSVRHFGPLLFNRGGRTLSSRLRHQLDDVEAVFAAEAPRLLARFIAGVERSLGEPIVNGATILLTSRYLETGSGDFVAQQATLAFSAMTAADAFSLDYSDAPRGSGPVGQTHLRPGSRDPERIFSVTDRLDTLRLELAAREGLRDLLMVARSHPLRRAG